MPSSRRTGTATRSRRSGSSVTVCAVAPLNRDRLPVVMTFGSEGVVFQNVTGTRAVCEPATSGGPFIFYCHMHSSPRRAEHSFVTKSISRLLDRLVDPHQLLQKRERQPLNLERTNWSTYGPYRCSLS